MKSNIYIRLYLKKNQLVNRINYIINNELSYIDTQSQINEFIKKTKTNIQNKKNEKWIRVKTLINLKNNLNYNIFTFYEFQPYIPNLTNIQFNKRETNILNKGNNIIFNNPYILIL